MSLGQVLLVCSPDVFTRDVPRDGIREVVTGEQHDARLILSARIGAHARKECVHCFAVLILPIIRHIRQSHWPEILNKRVV